MCEGDSINDSIMRKLEVLRKAIFETCPKKNDGLDWRDINKMLAELKDNINQLNKLRNLTK